jgi:hypothetical protein
MLCILDRCQVLRFYRVHGDVTHGGPPCVHLLLFCNEFVLLPTALYDWEVLQKVEYVPGNDVTVVVGHVLFFFVICFKNTI